MHLKSLWRINILMVVALMLAACSSFQAPEIPVVLPDNASNLQELCANPLFPIKVGATWTYSNTGGPGGTIIFTDMIRDVRAQGFTLTTQFNDLIRTQEWACLQEGLLTLTFNGGSAVGLSMQGMTAEFTTSNASGITIPADIQPGQEWTYSLDISGDIILPDGNRAQAEGTINMPMRALGMESVTVPAGTFEAMRIETNPTFDITANYLGFSIPLTLTGQIALWLSPGVGWVKSTESGEFGGSAFSSTTELQSFIIP